MKKKMFLLLLLCLIPSLVLASSDTSGFPVGVAIFMEAFVTIHMTVFVLIPISNMYGGNNSKNLLAILFVGRILLLLFFDFFVTPTVAIADFFAVFIGAFLIVPISAAITGKSAFGNKTMTVKTSSSNSKKVIEYNSMKKRPTEKTFVRCSYCGRLAYLSDETCDGCGAAFTEKDILKDWRE